MPQIFRFGEYWIYFWMNENKPLEPIHIHVAKGAPTANATKIWITSTGNCLLCNNNSKIPNHTLRNIMRMIEARNSNPIFRIFYCLRNIKDLQTIRFAGLFITVVLLSFYFGSSVTVSSLNPSHISAEIFHSLKSVTIL